MWRNLSLDKKYAVLLSICLALFLGAPSCGGYADDAARTVTRPLANRAARTATQSAADDAARIATQPFTRSSGQRVADDLQALSAREGVNIDVRQVQAASNNVRFLVLHRKAEKAYTIVASCQTGIESGDITEEISLELVKLENAVSEVCARIASGQYVQ
jgi:hypothetical protein